MVWFSLSYPNWVQRLCDRSLPLAFERTDWRKGLAGVRVLDVRRSTKTVRFAGGEIILSERRAGHSWLTFRAPPGEAGEIVLHIIVTKGGKWLAFRVACIVFSVKRHRWNWNL